MSAVPSSRSAFVMTSAGDGTVAKKVLATTPAASEPFIADLDKAHDDVIELANGRFGYNGWSSSIQNMKVRTDEKTRRVSVKTSVTVRLTLAEGAFCEATGNGCVKDCDSKAVAYETAKKSATTNALTEAFHCFNDSCDEREL